MLATYTLYVARLCGCIQYTWKANTQNRSNIICDRSMNGTKEQKAFGFSLSAGEPEKIPTCDSAYISTEHYVNPLCTSTLSSVNKFGRETTSFSTYQKFKRHSWHYWHIFLPLCNYGKRSPMLHSHATKARFNDMSMFPFT